MRAVVQRVTSAEVEVEGAIVGRIGRGLLVYLGVGQGDDDAALEYVLEKTLTLRVFEHGGKLDRSVLDVAGQLLVVSQFTLYGDVRRGRRPSFDAAMEPRGAEALYERFVARARERLPVETGTFRAHMSVRSENDGPITLWIDSQRSP